MLRIRTRLGYSPIHGIGLFAAEFVPAGTTTWQLDEGIDLVIPFELVEKLPEPARAQVYHYGYIDAGSTSITLCADDARFMNHADKPNTVGTPQGDIAALAIDIGDEITCDYYSFDHDVNRKLGAPN